MTLKVGLIGAGWISSPHARGWSRLGEKAGLVAVSDIDQTQAQKLAASYDIPAYNRYQDLIEQEDLDIVDICVPPHLHLEIVEAAAQAGLHILCEKPLAPTIEDADQIGVVLRKTAVTYMPAHNTLFLPTVQRAKNLLSKGHLGRIYLIRSLECYTDIPPEHWGIGEVRVPPALHRSSWRASKQLLKGGALIDGGYHGVYRLLYLAGSPPMAVTALMNRFHPGLDWETEDTATLLIQFQNGAIGQVVISYAFDPPTLGEDRLFTISGREGLLAGNETSLYLRPAGWQNATFQNLSTFQGEAAMEASIAAEIEHFVDCLTGQTELLQTYADARLTLKVVRAAYDSVEQGKTIGLDP